MPKTPRVRVVIDSRPPLTPKLAAVLAETIRRLPELSSPRPELERDRYGGVMGPVESAVRSRCRSGDRLKTPTGRGEFSIARIDEKGVVLLLGAQEAWTPLSWSCLEGVPEFLGSERWVLIGGRYDSTADPETLDGYLKHHVKRATAGWVAALLEYAGVVEIDRDRPARVRQSTAP